MPPEITLNRSLLSFHFKSIHKYITLSIAGLFLALFGSKFRFFFEIMIRESGHVQMDCCLTWKEFFRGYWFAKEKYIIYSVYNLSFFVSNFLFISKIIILVFLLGFLIYNFFTFIIFSSFFVFVVRIYHRVRIYLLLFIIHNSFF